MTVSLSRAQLFSRGAKGGAALLLAGSVAGSFAGSASADTIPDADLAYARLLVGAELLAADFYARAIASKQFIGHGARYVKRALFNEQEHYRSVSADPDRRRAAARDGRGLRLRVPEGSVRLEDLDREARHHAGDDVPRRVSRCGRRVADECAQAAGGADRGERGRAPECHHAARRRDPVGISFPNALTIDEASNALDAYIS